MWPFKRKKVYVEAEVVEPKELSLDMIINMELKNLANQGLSIRSKCQAIRNTIKRYKEMGYTFKHNFS
jgi:CRISPR/Cas system-associated endonuclease Cas3-HD